MHVDVNSHTGTAWGAVSGLLITTIKSTYSVFTDITLLSLGDTAIHAVIGGAIGSAVGYFVVKLIKSRDKKDVPPNE